MAKKPAAPKVKAKPHAHWEKLVSAAYLRMIGATQDEAATAVGRIDRTIRMWEADRELWEQARTEARHRWLNEAEDVARGAILASLKAGNADMGMRLLERIDARLAPKHKHELSGPDGGPIETAAKVTVYVPENDR